MNKKKKKSENNSESWRRIPQSSRRRKLTASARKRGRKMALYGLALVLLLASAFGLAAGGWYLVRESIRQMATTMQAPVVQNIHFQTDGVLSQDWLMEHLAEVPETPVFSLDLEELRERLIRNGQIKSVVIAKLPPHDLAIRLEERTPVLRLVTRDPETSQRMLLLVAEDGLVYQGYGYERSRLARLPFVDVARLERKGDGYGRLPGFPEVAELLRVAQEEAPELYHSWRTVSLRRLPLIDVRSDEVGQAVFPSQDFEEKIRKLRKVVTGMRIADYSHLDMVDLSLDNVPVRPAPRP